MIYFICTLSLVLDLFQKNYRLQSFGFYTLGIVWVCQTISLTIFVIWRGYLPLTSIVESMSVLTWLILTVSFMLTSMKQSDFMIVLLNIIGFIFMAIHTFHPYQFKLDVSRITAINELLVIHISLALLSYVVFAIAFVNAIIYIMQFQNLKRKRFTQHFFRISSLANIEHIVFLSSIIGNILLFVSLILGVQWGLVTIGLHIFRDLKVILSVAIFLCYTVYIALKLMKRLKPIVLIYFNMILFLSCMMNLIVITQVSSFHQWTGV
nr:cytochrome c biogenesis protein CcsA [Staphylococcus canis]